MGKETFAETRTMKFLLASCNISNEGIQPVIFNFLSYERRE
jgi:hypothetical protein